MSNPDRPVYRYPPRSHAYSCRCPRCAPFKGRPMQSGAWIWVAIPVAAGIWWIALAPLHIWHVIGADGKEHPDAATWIAYGACGGLVVLLLMFFSIRAAGKRPKIYPPAIPPR